MRIPGKIAGASLVVALAACGSDAPLHDAAVEHDATPDDGAVPVDTSSPFDAVPTGTITVTAHAREHTDAPGPAEGIAVYAITFDGVVADTATTGVDGTATLDVTAGDSVTAVYPAPNGADLITIAQVAPGDSLTVGDHFAAPGALGTMTMSWDALDGASSYRVVTACGQAVPTGTSHVFSPPASCSRPIGDYAVLARDGAGDLLGWTELDDVAFVDEGTMTFPAWTAVTGELALSVAGLPVEVETGGLDADVVVEGVHAYGLSTSTPVTGGELDLAGPWPTGQGARIAAMATLERPSFGEQRVRETLAASATAWTLNDPVLLPWVGGVTVDAALGAVDWEQSALDGYDGATVYVQWLRIPPPALFGSPNNRYFRWRVVLPPGATALVLPQLPAALAEYQPVAGDELDVEVRLLDLADDADYDALRARPEWVLGCLECAHEAGEVTGRSIEARNLVLN